MANLSAKPTRPHNLIFRSEGDRVIVYNPVTDQLHAFHPLGAEILKQCDGNLSVEEIITRLPEDLPQRETLVKHFLNELAARQLIA